MAINNQPESGALEQTSRAALAMALVMTPGDLCILASKVSQAAEALVV